MRFSKNIFTSFTVSIATPAVFTLTDHELAAGDSIVLETTGALPTGLAVDTTYYVINDGYTAGLFQVAISVDGDAINTTGTQSGAHTLLKTNRANLNPNIEDTR